MPGNDPETILRMSASPLLVLSEREIGRIASAVQTPEEIARALWDYAWIGWQRGQRFERARAADRAMRWWSPWWRWRRR